MVDRNNVQMRVLSAESIAIFKLLFNRSKDWVDLERLVEVENGMDIDYVTDKLLELNDNNMEEQRIIHWVNLVKQKREGKK